MKRGGRERKRKKKEEESAQEIKKPRLIPLAPTQKHPYNGGDICLIGPDLIMFRSFLAFALIFLVSACAWTTQTSLQDVAFETPGALDAECEVLVGKTKYVVHPPQTIILPKSVETMHVNCLAPGGREKSWEYLPKVSPMILADSTLGMAPAIWDHYSGALYYYPDKVVIDFRGVPTVPIPLPSYHNPDTVPPRLSGLDEETPGMPGLNADPVVPYPLEKIERPIRLKPPALIPPESRSDNTGNGNNSIGEVIERSISSAPALKSPPISKTKDLTRQYNPQVFGTENSNSPPPSTTPIPLTTP